MVFVLYLIVASAVVLLSMKASEYVDLLDKKTELSGAFIGGVLLSAVTSLPELFTSLSSTMLLDKPGLCIGNILGSNIFNSMVLAVLILIFFKPFSKTDIAKSHVWVALFVTLIYGVLLLNFAGVLDFDFLTVNITSYAVIIFYILGVRNMKADDGDRQEETSSTLTVKQIVRRFIFVGIGIIFTSIVITFITDKIAEILNLQSGLAGALFLGIATSLPELSSTIMLFRIRNYNIAIGNIIGSNLFNFLILTIADISYFGSGVYDFSDSKTQNLLIFGAISAPAMLVLTKFKNKAVRLICPIIAVLCYIAFLAIN